MRLELITRHATRVSQWSAIALAVSIPVSTALDNVFLAVTLAAWALSGRIVETIKLTLKNKVLWCPIILFGALALGTLYGATPLREAFSHLWKYADLLFIPLFALAFRESDTRVKALHAFAITLAVIIVLSCLLRLGILPRLPLFASDGVSPTVFKLKVTHSFLVAFSAFLFAWLGRNTANPRLRLVWYGFALLAAINVLFVVKGATGYVVLIALFLLWGAERISQRNAKRAILLMAGIATALILIPSPFQERLKLTQKEIQLWRADTPAAISTSAGLRMEFYKNTLDIIAADPLTGVGTGGFPQAYAQQVKYSDRFQTHNPHNEFLNVAAQIGIIGMLVLMAMFWLQWRSAPKLATPMEQSLARALVLTLVCGCMVNSLLLDHTEGLFYAWLSGLLYSSLKYGLSENLPANTLKKSLAQP